MQHFFLLLRYFTTRASLSYKYFQIQLATLSVVFRFSSMNLVEKLKKKTISKSYTLVPLVYIAINFSRGKGILAR